jgi:hypothetical protein
MSSVALLEKFGPSGCEFREERLVGREVQEEASPEPIE